MFMGPIVPKLVDIACSVISEVRKPALRVLGDVVAGTDASTQVILDSGILQKIEPLLDNPDSNTRKEAVWLLSNVTAGT